MEVSKLRINIVGNMNKESKIIPINSTTDAFRNQTALFLQHMLDVNEWILSFPLIGGKDNINSLTSSIRCRNNAV